ncbi:MAG: hypothetical protein HZB25_03345 [Candidatus Eisenbacteria bacterium]|nr:hypothetical protein [Candidatus Eisenbacteria bacterium]
MNRRVATASALAALALTVAAHAPAATIPVSILKNGVTNFKFTPATVTAQLGDSVKWTNSTTLIHTASSGDFNGGQDGVFDTGLIAANATKVSKMLVSGDHPYFCQVHGDPDFYPGFVGLVHVPAPTPVKAQTWGRIRRAFLSGAR